MAQNKLFGFGPVALTTTLTTNILNPAVTSMSGPVGITIAQPYVIIRRIRIVNKDSSARTFTLYIGATGANTAGTEFLGTAQSVAANSSYEWYGAKRMDSTQFLVGGASANTTLTIEGDIEIGIS